MTAAASLLSAALLAGSFALGSFSTVDLFVAGTEGYELYRIPGIVATARGSLRAYADTRRAPYRLLFVHPDNLLRADKEGEPGRIRDRRNLTVQLSEDRGASRPIKRVIEPGLAGYADLAVARGGTIYCLYERGAGGLDQFRPAALTLARFDLAWVKGEVPRPRRRAAR